MADSGNITRKILIGINFSPSRFCTRHYRKEDNLCKLNMADR